MGKGVKIVVMGIYKITSPSGRVYVGQSKDVYKRFSQYRVNNISDQPKLYNSFVKHGIKNHSFEVIGEYEAEVLDEMEIFFINKFNSIKKGMNCKHGGHRAGLQGDSIIKLSNSLKEANKRPEVKERRAAWQRGRKMSEEAKEKMRQAKLGKPANINQIEKAKNNNYAGKGQIEIYKDGILVTTELNLHKAAEFMNGDYRNIHRAVTNPKYTFHKGFTFKRVAAVNVA